jgi:hypothetical protein
VTSPGADGPVAASSPWPVLSPTAPTAPSAPAVRLPGARSLAWALGLVVIGSLVLALTVPVGTAAVGIVLFGVLAVVLELRYLGGRFGLMPVRSSGTVTLAVGALVAVAVASRAVAPAGRGAGAVVGVVATYGLLTLVAHRCLRGRVRRAALGVVAVGAALSLAFPDQHLVVLAHLHHLVPAVLVWDWSSRRSARGRRAVRWVVAGWVVLVPALLLSGALDGLLHADVDLVRGLADGAVGAFGAPPGAGAGALAERLLTLFAFSQTVQLAVWVGLLPHWAPDVSADLETRLPWLTGARLWVVGFTAAAVLAVLFARDYALGARVFTALSAAPMLLELAAVLLLVAGGAGIVGVARARADLPPDVGAPASDDGGERAA